MRAILLASAGAVLLAGCGDGDGTSISIKSDEGGTEKTVLSTSSDGAVKIDTPVFKGDLKLPAFTIDGANLQLDGLDLYPGSKVRDVKVNARDGQGGVQIAFDSPAPADVVRRWYQDALADAGIRVTGDGMSGQTDGGKPFRISLGENGGEASQGTITIGN
jgi:hypothetical protein